MYDWWSIDDFFLSWVLDVSALVLSARRGNIPLFPGIYKISVIDKNIEKIILSSGKRFYLNSIIDFLEKKFDLKINKNNLSKDKKNFKAIGSNYLAKKILNYKSKKTPIDVCKEILKNYE